MRRSLLLYLKNNCTTVTEWRYPYVATAATPKPYGVLKFLGVLRNPGNRHTTFHRVQVWPYFERNAVMSLDAAVSEIRRLLHGARIPWEDGGGYFTLEWVQTLEDYYDDELQGLTRRIDFEAPGLV